MLGDVHYSPMAGRQAGSVLAEFLVVSAAVLVPLAILMPLLFKYIENRQYVEQAARYAAWERTAYYLSAPSHLPSSAPVKGAAQIQREVDNRILAEGQAPIHRHSALNYVTPQQRHTGEADQILAQRKQVIEAAKAANPQRWSGSIRNLSLPDSVTLNPEKAVNC